MNPFKKHENEEVNEEVHLDLDKPVEKKKTPKGSRCPDCPLKAGLKDDFTLCPTCNGTGLV